MMLDDRQASAVAENQRARQHRRIDLHDVATDIKAAWDSAHGQHGQAIHGYLRIGQLLRAARKQLPSKKAYGDWLSGQGFVFTSEWARKMRVAAEYENEVRAWWANELEAGREPGLNRCLRDLRSTSSPPTAPAIATPVAINYPESERRAWVAEQCAPRFGRNQRATQIVNNIEDALRAWEHDHEVELADTVAPYLNPDLDTDEREDVVGEVLAVLRGE